tara:strand:- start:342 stop:506 length:165 start_codon:yes stop_codon:yes gene_type:complete
MVGVYFFLAIIIVGWLFVWSVLVDRKPEKFEKRGPFAFRDMDEFEKKYGKRYPF